LPFRSLKSRFCAFAKDKHSTRLHTQFKNNIKNKNKGFRHKPFLEVFLSFETLKEKVFLVFEIGYDHIISLPVNQWVLHLFIIYVFENDEKNAINLLPSAFVFLHICVTLAITWNVLKIDCFEEKKSLNIFPLKINSDSLFVQHPELINEKNFEAPSKQTWLCLPIKNLSRANLILSLHSVCSNIQKKIGKQKLVLWF